MVFILRFSRNRFDIVSFKNPWKLAFIKKIIQYKLIKFLYFWEGLKQKALSQNGFESVKNGFESNKSIFQTDHSQIEWIRIHEKGFEYDDEHHTFPKNGFESSWKRFESVDEHHVFPENGFEFAWKGFESKRLFFKQNVWNQSWIRI